MDEPDLFAYQAGAVYEGKRDYDHAIQEYVRGALADRRPFGEPFALAGPGKRKPLGAIVDRLTAEKAAGTNPSLAAVSLRVDVLQTLKRRDALGEFSDLARRNHVIAHHARKNRICRCKPGI